VTQVDVAASFSSPYRLRRSTPRFTTPSVRFPSSAFTRAYSLQANAQPDGNVSDLKKNELGEGTSGFALYEHEGVTGENLEDMFMEITPESIDALAAETMFEPEPLSIPQSVPQSIPQSRELHDGKQRKKPRWELDPEVEKTRFRSIKLDNAVKASPQASTSKIDRHETNRHDKSNPEKDDWKPESRPAWQVHKEAIKMKFPEGWKPMKKLSPEAQAGIRALHAQYPDRYTTAALSAHFEVDPEAMRRILKSKWVPSPDEQMDRERRWFRRGKDVWNRYAQLGVKPPKKWREEGIGRGKPEWKKKRALTTSRPGFSSSVDDVDDAEFDEIVEEDESDGLQDRIL
jgi:hypothetical protein